MASGICILVSIAITRGQVGLFREPAIVPDPPHYACHRSSGPLCVDGKLDEADWQKAEPFGLIDIRGPQFPQPRHATTVKLLWDDIFFYVGAELEEPDLWATLKDRDGIVYQDNDFEVFIDPDGDTHRYAEIEINALNTVWDLFLDKPYRDGGLPLSHWDIRGLKHAVLLKGTINQARDRDQGWSVELGIPWTALAEFSPEHRPPLPGEFWRVNFSRVQWHLTPSGFGYEKTKDEHGKTLPEDNWVWSPQGLINMHYPEMWGIVQFTVEPSGSASVSPGSSEEIRWALRRIYYKQKKYFQTHKNYTERFEDLGLEDSLSGPWLWPPEMEAGASFFRAKTICKHSDTAWMIDHEGRIRSAMK